MADAGYGPHLVSASPTAIAAEPSLGLADPLTRHSSGHAVSFGLSAISSDMP